MVWVSESALRGVGAAAGAALGPALIWRPEAPAPAAPAGPPAAEEARLRRGITAAEAELDALIAAAPAEAREMLQAQRLMLADPELIGLAAAGIAAGQAAEVAAAAAAAEFAATLAALPDPYLRERAADVRDAGRRLAAAIAGHSGNLRLVHPCVVVARDLAPAETVGLDRRLLLGIVTEQGGPTAHTSILARSWGIPAVVAAAGVLDRSEPGVTVALDGTTGEVVLDPAPATAARFAERIRAQQAEAAAGMVGAGAAAITPDGRRVELAANAGHPDEVAPALGRGAEGIGLLRSEFLFMGRPAPPDEEEQYAAYRAALAAAGGRRVIIRTLDIGGDKDVPYLGLPPEPNPFLGVRALRLCLRRPDLFRTQLRALLRAGVHGKLAVMFPMVGGLADLGAARAALAAARDELAAAGVPHDPAPELGMMVEIPSAALLAAHLAPEVDFFSIGTNDLVQYTLAVDRGNPELAPLYEPYHPAVLQLVAGVVQAADAAGKWVGVCGELAGDPVGALLLLGLGVHELSMAPGALPAVRRVVLATPYGEAAAVARQALACATAAAVLALARAALPK